MRLLLHILDAFSIPKGLRPPAQGCEQRATLGNQIERVSNPERVVAVAIIAWRANTA